MRSLTAAKLSMMTTLLNNRYQISQVLGAGGFGETFLAEDTYMPSRRQCVIKQLKPVTNDPQMYLLIQQRFQREAATLEALGEGSDQIPKLYAYFLENGQFHLVQEWIQGQTLTAKVAAEGPLSESVVTEILASLLLVLDFVHSKGIIYRDIKPDNIIVRQSNDQPVLIDFGAVKETMTTVVNSKGTPTYSIVLGTPGFMSPEQATGRPIYGSDLYSLGMTAIYLLTGLLPQELETDPQTEEILWRQYAPNVSPHLAAVLDKAIQYHPRDRYTTAIKMLDALHASIPLKPPSTQATVALSSTDELSSSQIPASPQPAPIIKHTSSQGNRQKTILGMLGVSLIGTAIAVGLVSNKLPQSASLTSPQIQSTSEPIAISTPRATESPAPSSNPNSPSTSVNTQSPSPPPNLVVANKEQTPSTPPPSPEPALQKVNENRAVNSIPGFPTGTSESTLKAALGNPTRTSDGYFPNTRALLYELKPNQVSLGYIFDRSSGRLRQTEVSFAQSVEPEMMQATLQGMLNYRALINVNQGLQRVYDRRANRYSFNVDGLKGVIERNDRDRIYVGVWDADLH